MYGLLHMIKQVCVVLSHVFCQFELYVKYRILLVHPIDEICSMLGVGQIGAPRCNYTFLWKTSANN